jgi:hypothetical protein
MLRTLILLTLLVPAIATADDNDSSDTITSSYAAQTLVVDAAGLGLRGTGEIL